MTTSGVLDRRGPLQRQQHVGDHRTGEPQAKWIGDAGAQTSLGEGEALDRNDRDGAQVPDDSAWGADDGAWGADDAGAPTMVPGAPTMVPGRGGSRSDGIDEVAGYAARAFDEAERPLGDAGGARRVLHARVRLQRGQPGDVLVGHHPVEQLAVEVGHPVCTAVQRREGHERGRRTLQHLAAHDRADGDDRGARRGDRLANPGTARIGAIEASGLDGPMTIAFAPSMAASARALGCGLLGAAELEALHESLCTLANHELLEGVPAARRANPGAHRIVAHRQYPRAYADRFVQPLDRRRGGRSLGEHPGPLKTPGEVAVAEVEPHLGAERSQPIHHREGVSLSPQPRSSSRSASQKDSRSGSGETCAP